MIPQLSKALSSGFTQKQVIDFILKKFPEHSDKIKSAMAAGFTVDQILRFLGKGKEVLNPQQKNIRGGTEFERTRTNDLQKRESINQGALAAGTLAATSLAAPMAATALKRALPTALGSLIPNGTEASQPQKIPPTPSQPPINTQNITQETQVVQPEVKSINANEILNKHKSKEKVDQLLQAGNDPQRVAGYFQKFSESIKKAIEQEAGKSFEEVIAEYQAQSGNSSEKTPILSENMPENAEIGRNQEEISPKIEKSSMVASPKGMGEVKEIRNGKALIEVDGKLHKVDEDELIQSPLPEKDLADLYDDLISGIEEGTGQQVSRNVEWAGYDPISNELAYKPHGSDKLYAYGDISPEDIEQLTNLLTQRKSTGENFIGAWKAGTTSPIGAAMYQLIKKLQGERGGKGNEYKNKYETIYDAIEPAKKAAKKKHAERRKKKT